MSPSQMSGVRALPAIMVGLRGAEEWLAKALRRTGMVAAAAAWDPDAVPALCILALGIATQVAQSVPHKPSCSALQPATVECLRCVTRLGSLLVKLTACQQLAPTAHVQLATCSSIIYDVCVLCQAVLCSDAASNKTFLSPQVCSQ